MHLEGNINALSRPRSSAGGLQHLVAFHGIPKNCLPKLIHTLIRHFVSLRGGFTRVTRSEMQAAQKSLSHPGGPRLVPIAPGEFHTQRPSHILSPSSRVHTCVHKHVHGDFKGLKNLFPKGVKIWPTSVLKGLIPPFFPPYIIHL